MVPMQVAMSFRSWVLLLCAAGGMLAAHGTQAAERDGLREAKAAYQRERAACLSGQGGEERAVCLREAAAALQEARRGQLNDGGQTEFERNRLLRCDLQPPQDRPDCIRRMNGEGIVSGSVEGGGIYRELTTPVIPGKSD